MHATQKPSTCSDRYISYHSARIQGAAFCAASLTAKSGYLQAGNRVHVSDVSSVTDSVSTVLLCVFVSALFSVFGLLEVQEGRRAQRRKCLSSHCVCVCAAALLAGGFATHTTGTSTSQNAGSSERTQTHTAPSARQPAPPPPRSSTPSAAARATADAPPPASTAGLTATAAATASAAAAAEAVLAAATAAAVAARIAAAVAAAAAVASVTASALRARPRSMEHIRKRKGGRGGSRGVSDLQEGLCSGSGGRDDPMELSESGAEEEEISPGELFLGSSMMCSFSACAG